MESRFLFHMSLIWWMIYFSIVLWWLLWHCLFSRSVYFTLNQQHPGLWVDCFTTWICFLLHARSHSHIRQISLESCFPLYCGSGVSQQCVHSNVSQSCVTVDKTKIFWPWGGGVVGGELEEHWSQGRFQQNSPSPGNAKAAFTRTCIRT